MDLSTYIEKHGGAQLARDLGVSRSMTSLWRSGDRQPGPVMARRIEAATGGQVKAETIRPDVFGPLDGS